MYFFNLSLFSNPILLACALLKFGLDWVASSPQDLTFCFQNPDREELARGRESFLAISSQRCRKICPLSRWTRHWKSHLRLLAKLYNNRHGVFIRLGIQIPSSGWLASLTLKLEKGGRHSSVVLSIYAFFNLYYRNRENDENKQKEAGIGPFFLKKLYN